MAPTGEYDPRGREEPDGARVRVRILARETQPPGDRTICYCLNETEAAIRQEIRETGMTRVVERVRSYIAAHRCACEVLNPRGRCCLGDVIAAVRMAEAG